MKTMMKQHHNSDEHNKKERYIHSGEMEFARQLAQKMYNERTLMLAKKRLGQIERMLKEYDDFEIDNAYEKLHPARKILITPVEKTIQQRYEEWLKAEYQGKEFREGTPLIFSERGDRVRSKSEKLIADYLFRNNIEYKYEKPLYLKGYGNIYPDFTFFSRKIGKEIYWEHDGKMDDPDYARKAVNKIEAYENSGIYLGEQLIVTFETSEKVLGTKEIEKVAQRFLIS